MDGRSDMPRSAEQVVGQLLQHYRAGRSHLFIQQAHQVLSEVPHMPELAKPLLRALLEQGLGGPARELVHLRQDLDPTDAEVRALRTRLESVAHGRVAWPARREIFERNVAVLAAKGDGFRDAKERFLKRLPAVHLFRTAAGDYQIARRRPGQLRQWWTSLTSRAEEQRVTLPDRGQLGPTAIVGVMNGKLMQRICERTDKLFLTLSHPIFVVESDETRLAAWLHCGDHTGWLADKRVYVFAGQEAASEFERTLQADPDLPLPTHFVNLGGRAEPLQLVQSAVARIAQRRCAELQRLQQELQDRYGGRDQAYWAKRWESRGGVLALTSRFTTMLQYSTQDALRALAESGYHTQAMLEADDYHRLSPITVCRRLLEVDPDFILVLDHLQYEYPHIPRNLPFLTWIQDPLPNLLSRQAGESVGPLHFVCGYYRKRCVEEFGYPAQRFAHTSLPVSARLFRDDRLDTESIERYAADVCFVSNASTPIEQLRDSAIRENPPQLGPLLELIYQRMVQVLSEGGFVRQREVPDLLRSAARETGVQLTPQQFEKIWHFYAFRLFDWGRRQQTLEWVASWARRTSRTFRIYGRGWETHPTLAEFAVGVIEHGEPLRRAYRASKLAVQSIPSGFVHQRTFEALAAGTLPLVRYSPSDFEHPSVGEPRPTQDADSRHRNQRNRLPDLSRVVFRTPEEFEALAQSYLRDPELHESTRSEFREAVRQNYTYEAVLPGLVAQMRDAICRCEAPEQARRG